MGSALGKYRIVAPLGRGGMAEVYKGYQSSLDRYVAIKVLPPDVSSDADFVARFEREAAAIARLRHPHIVQVYDFDAQNGMYFMVMEYVSGPTLKDEIRQRRAQGRGFTLEEIGRLISALAQAIDYAHSRGMVHHDVKPSNVMFTAEGHVVLTDFGIARILDATSNTVTGAIAGTPAYMAPEQGNGQRGDGRSDIYSLGVILYELAAGRVPFEAETPLAVILRHINAPPAPPRSVNPALSEAVERVILKALQKSPADRYQTAGELAEAFCAAAMPPGASIRNGSSFTPITALAAARPAAPEEEATASLVPEGATQQHAPPCPYRGLFAFREQDAPFFFGREEFTAQLLDGVRRKALVAVVGPSGSGKSSVVFAGLLPQLAASAQTPGARADGAGLWRVASLRPASQPFQALASALVPLLEPALGETDRLVEARKLGAALSAGEVGLYDVAERIAQKRDGAGRVLLVLDQFEELYTLCPDAGERRRFVDSLLEACETRRGRREPLITFVLTLRADFLGQALMHRPFANALQDNSLILGPMTRDELSRAVANPAAKQGIHFESGLVDRILDDVGAEPGQLPLLEFALTALWEQQRGRQLPHAGYEAIGRVEGALARYAEEVYAGLSQSEKEGARRVFVQLVRPGEGTEDTRRAATRAELGEGDWGLAQQLAGARLIVTDRDSSGQDTAEIVHEALIRTWTRLREWMQADRTFRAWQERLRAALRQWEASGRDDGALLRGAPLAEAEGWLLQRDAGLGAAEREFIRSSVAQRGRETSERDAQRQRELLTARKLAETERRRAEEHKRSVNQLRQRALLLTIALAIAAALAMVAFGLFQLATQNGARADVQLGEAVQQRSTAEAASTLAVAQQATAQYLAGVRATAEADAVQQSDAARKQARIALARELAAASLSTLRLDPERSMLLALQSISTTLPVDGVVLPEAEDALHRAVPALHLLLTLRGHTQKVNAVAFSPDGTRVATAGEDRIVKVWDIAQGTLLFELKGHDGVVWSVAFSPDGRRLATGSADHTARIWDAGSGRQLQMLTGHDNEVADVAFSADGARLATASLDSTARVWDLASGQSVATLPHDRFVNAVAFSPDGTRVATAVFDGTARVWDLTPPEGPKELFALRSNTTQMLDVAFSPDGTRVATAALDGTAVIWDAGGGQPVLTLAGHNQAINSVAFSADGKHIATASSDGTAKIWDTQLGREELTLYGHTGGLLGVAFSPDGKRLATASEDKTAKIWDTSPGREWLILAGHTSRIWGVGYSPDNTRVATSSTDTTAKIWDARSGKLLLTLSGHTGPVYAVAFSPDGTSIATASYDGSAKLWDARSGKLALTLRGHRDRVQDVGFSPDGKRLLTASRDGTAVLWDAGTGKQLLALAGHTEGLQGAAFSPDGKRIVTASLDDSARVWDASSGKQLLVLSGHNNDVLYAVYSPDGTHIAIARRDGTTMVFDAVSGQELLNLSGHTGAVWRVTYSPDGKRIATASWDGTAKLWDAATGQEMVTLTGHTGEVTSVAFSPDGTRLITGSWDGTARMYVMGINELVALARARVTRGLTAEECQKYLHSATCP